MTGLRESRVVAAGKLLGQIASSKKMPAIIRYQENNLDPKGEIAIIKYLHLEIKKACNGTMISIL